MAPQKQPRKQPQAAKGAETTAQSSQSSQAPDGTAASEQSSHQGLRLNLPPINNVHQAFKDLVSKRQPEIIAMANNGGFQLRVGTICSGTEAPIFALKLIKEISQVITSGQKFMQFNHLFSVENEPFKQAYISRNAPGSIIFRDVVDFADRNATTAPTILGDHCDIPPNIDLLIAGTSCVDFSTLSSRKKNSVQLMSKGAMLMEEFKKSDRSSENPKSKLPPLREDYFDDVREWLNSITPAQIQKTGKSIGESSTTFLSTVCYINNHRPKMVILENVYNAPWSSMCGLFLHAANYAATHVSVDTKDYYIPQTRNRGYVVAVDRQVFGSSAEQITNEWKTQLRSLKRAASTPVQNWLLSSNDPLTMRARQYESEKAVSNSLNPGRDSQWERSKLRHVRVRRMFQLGNGRPLTAWGLGGIEHPYDRIDRLIIKGQNDRALDCVDIYYLRCLCARLETLAGNAKAQKGSTGWGPMQYDIKFKSQIFDLSQNIDRGQISRNFGITGCLTPRGMNLITDQGRLVSGFEALNLQGLPLRDLDLTGESQDELRDLAGNAMSTTVVGAALFSLLLAINIHGNSVDPLPLSKISMKDQAVLSYQPLYRPSSMEPTSEQTSWSSTREPLCDVQLVIDISKRCRRYCYCNGGAKYSTDELVCCKVCNITRCTNCAGNPKHQFGPPLSIKDPIMNDTAPQELMELFPTALTNIISDAINHIPFHPDFREPELQSMLLDSLRSAIFYYTRVLISETVTICYSAKDSNFSFHLQAVASDRGVTWYLFLDPWSRCGQVLSKKLGIPAGQMLRPFGRVCIYPSTNGFIPEQNAWEFWVFKKIPFKVELAQPRPGSIEIKGTPLANVPVAARANIQSIVGIYDHHPECDAAEDSLHAAIQDSKRYLFKDPTRIGLTQEDCYIISDECRLLENHEFRDFCVKFPPPWTPREARLSLEAFIEGYWETAAVYHTHSQATFENSLVSYTRKAGYRAIPSSSELQLNECHGVRTLASVCIDSNMLDDTFMTLSKYERAGPDNWAVVLRSDYSALFDLLAPVNVNLRGIESITSSTFTKSCERYCPSLPDVHWMEKAIVATKLSDRNAREPYRLSCEIRAYEEELRKSGEPLQVAVNIKDSENGNGWKEVKANYEVNVDLLVHRAANHFPRPKDHSGVLPIRAEVDIKRGSLIIPNLKFESFGKSLRRLPGGSCRESTEYSELFIGGHALTEQQRTSLSWMLDRERNPPPFTEREIEECRSDPLNLRVLAVAKRDVSRAGGILADDVGYGKTVVTLALMAAEQYCDQKSRQERRDNGEGTSALAASLVFVPKHLVNQWRDEAAKFLGWKSPDVLVIKSYSNLQGILGEAESGGEVPPSRAKRLKTAKKSATLLDELQAAKLIIVSTALFDDRYYQWLGKYAGSLAPPRAIPRTDCTKDTTNPNVLGAFQDWYEDATAHARKHLSGFDPAIFNSNKLKIIEQRQKSLQDSWKNVVADYYDASTRLGCQTDTTVDREYGDTARAAGLLTKEDFKNKETKFLHVLEAFSFARVIYDEFSYENFCVAQFVKNAKARAKWVLSATPPTSNVKSVCDIGQLLQIHVARPVKLRPGLPLITEGPVLLRQSSTEKQLSYGKLYTDKSVYERVEQAHEFLRHFASANPFDEEGSSRIKVNENVICSHMTRIELIRYLDLQRDLQILNLEISDLLERHKIKCKTIDEFPTEGRLRAGLALAFVASVSCTVDDDGDMNRLLSNRRRNLEAAQKELKRITNVAIWLVLRRSQEIGDKKNDSATNIVEDLACHFESILDGNAEDFGGAETLEAITSSVFDKKQCEECSQWLRSVQPGERTSEGFLKTFFALLDKQMAEPEWVNYFQLPADRIASLRDPEVHALIRDLGGRDHSQLPLSEARQHLRELFLGKRSSADSQPQQPKNSHKKVSKRKVQTQPDNEANASNEAAKDDDDSRPKYPRFGVRKRIRGGDYTETESEITDIMLKLIEAKEDVMVRMKQVTTASNLFCPDHMRKCSACGQSCNDLRFLPECGHFICSSHLSARFCGQIKSEKYPNGNGCSALIHKRSIAVEQIDRCEITDPLPANAFGGKEPPKVSSKSQKIIRTVNQILRNSNDRVLVFYQFEEQQEEICHLLRHQRTAFDAHPSTGAGVPAAKQNSDKERVRFLMLNSEEAAGSNFQDANHVMFVSTPVFGKQEEFEKYVKQAKGRAVRHGQQGDVQVYYFVTVNTFEVDLLQLRKRSTIKLRDGGVADFVVDGEQNTDEDRCADKDKDANMVDARRTSRLSDEEVWRLTDETNWLVQQNREF
ncbi:hypothetical protein E0Z10_g120 [Xylaria hypoxylon]|uniref:Helicase ATP-binding domain-containing protein n=1 Tax=Xylaria hypoxylon TaxID=37992 RepID=A0A4Z0ZIB8_9PEZI|nr:hypothetical protein E0Z10_g120 [Xylaria hypoxylon]